MKAHGDAETEVSRGQLPVGPEDFEKLPSIVSEPDRVVFGGKTKRRGLDSIGYVKRLDDGTVAHVEERRTGKKQLASVTMVKHPAGADVDRVAENLHMNARSGGSGADPMIVRGPEADKADVNPDTILHQSQIPNWFKNQPAPAEGEGHPSYVSRRRHLL